MLTRLSILPVLALVVLGTAAGCKTDPPESTAKGPAATESSSTAKPRSGKIDLAPRRPSLPGSADAPAADGAEPGERMSQQSREDRRKQRMASMDTDGDGIVSDEERAAARAQRDAEIKARLDTDGDGTVSDAERTAARLERADNLRTRLDKDGDGKLTAAELQNAPFRRFDAAGADTDGDGLISTEELDQAIEARGGERGMRWRDRRGRGMQPPPSE